MSSIKTISPKIVKPDIDAELRKKFKQQAQEQSIVILHCYYFPTAFNDMIRIWKSTFLIAHDSTHRSALLHAENIDLYPEWTQLTPGILYAFTLLFEGLPKSCTAFDMLEDIPEEGGFFIPDIARNKSDVYDVVID
ncbi:MAG: hypothetical protein IPH61_03850 [Bacteroidetes bacterium]|nr:hypothetical protein [Bacteroidota bacterium]MBK8486276.1 hypothetical protein [Bacteroidota bacterium]